MDLEEIKKYSKNKIEADNLIKQVRQQIKETTWEKQNLREGFTETFKPLISQFEKPEDPKQKNIFTQNQKMLQNQLALTEGLKANQKAITDGFSQFERLADMREFPGVESIEDGEDEEDEKDDQAQAPLPKEDKTPIAKFKVSDLDVNLDEKKLNLLINYGFENPPSYYFNKSLEEIDKIIDTANSDLKDLGNSLHNTAEIYYENGYQLAKPINKKPQKKTRENIESFNAISIFAKNLNDLSIFKQKSGSGIVFYKSPQEILKRFELLNGSLVAGNNGVLPEYIQIAHRLQDLGIITNNQLNKLLRKVI